MAMTTVTMRTLTMRPVCRLPGFSGAVLSAGDAGGGGKDGQLVIRSKRGLKDGAGTLSGDLFSSGSWVSTSGRNRNLRSVARGH